MTIKEVSEKFHISSDTLRYYERIGMLPPVNRADSGIRDYTNEDLNWLELILCMRNAGLQIEAIIEYVKLYSMGDATFEARLALLKEQREKLLCQQEQITKALDRLNYKISRYETAVETGRLSWDNEKCEKSAKNNEPESASDCD